MIDKDLFIKKIEESVSKVIVGKKDVWKNYW